MQKHVMTVFIRSSAQQSVFQMDVYLKLKGVLNSNSRNELYSPPISCYNMEPTVHVSPELMVEDHDKMSKNLPLYINSKNEPLFYINN